MQYKFCTSSTRYEPMQIARFGLAGLTLKKASDMEVVETAKAAEAVEVAQAARAVETGNEAAEAGNRAAESAGRAAEAEDAGRVAEVTAGAEAKTGTKAALWAPAIAGTVAMAEHHATVGNKATIVGRTVAGAMVRALARAGTEAVEKAVAKAVARAAGTTGRGCTSETCRPIWKRTP